MTRASTNQQGFTLIEVLVALLLMALLSVISWQALDVVERSSERLNASTDDTMALARVLGQIEIDISRHADGEVLLQSVQTGSSAPSTAPVRTLPAGIGWVEPVLTVVRSANDGAWQQVAWGKDGNTLRRAVGAAAQTLPLPGLGAGDIVLDQVQNFTVRAWIPGQGWSPVNSADNRPKATGLEITIKRQHNGISETYRKVLLLP